MHLWAPQDRGDTPQRGGVQHPRGGLWVLHAPQPHGEQRVAFLPGWGTQTGGEGRLFEQTCLAAIHHAHQVGVRIREALRAWFSEGAQ